MSEVPIKNTFVHYVIPKAPAPAEMARYATWHSVTSTKVSGEEGLADPSPRNEDDAAWSPHNSPLSANGNIPRAPPPQTLDNMTRMITYDVFNPPHAEPAYVNVNCGSLPFSPPSAELAALERLRSLACEGNMFHRAEIDALALRFQTVFREMEEELSRLCVENASLRAKTNELVKPNQPGANFQPISLSLDAHIGCPNAMSTPLSLGSALGVSSSPIPGGHAAAAPIAVEGATSANALELVPGLAPGSLRVNWMAEARKLKGNDRQAVSPKFVVPFDGFTLPFRILIHALATDEGRAGQSFRKANGKGKLELKCEGRVGVKAMMRYTFEPGKTGDGAGQEARPQGEPDPMEVENDFKERLICSDDNVWDFQKYIKPDKPTMFLVCLDIDTNVLA